MSTDLLWQKSQLTITGHALTETWVRLVQDIDQEIPCKLAENGRLGSESSYSQCCLSADGPCIPQDRTSICCQRLRRVRTEDRVCVLCQSRNKPNGASEVAFLAQSTNCRTWQPAHRKIL